MFFNYNFQIQMKHSNSKSQLTCKSKIIHSDKQDNTATNRTKRHSKTVLSVKDNTAKPNNKTKDESQLTTIKKQQLYSIIQTFYTTLCDLPLQKLVSSGQPDLWLCEQQGTLSELNKKLNKFTFDNNCEYYRWKLNSVESILANIKQNMGMMARINHLKNYYSGTDSSNYRSRTSSSCESERRDMKLGDLAKIEHKTVQQMLSYDQYIIKQEKMIQQNPSIQIQAQTVNSDSEESLSRSQFFNKNKETKRQRMIPKQSQNRNASNFNKKIKTTQQETHYNSKQFKDKTLTKAQVGKSTHFQRTISNYTNQGKFLQDKIMSRELNKLRSGSEREQRQNENTVESSKLQQGNTMYEQVSKQNNMGEYVQIIKQLRCELIDKDKQIERLLINQQQYEQAIQMMKQHEKNKNKETMFLKQNISNCNRDKQKMSHEIKRLIQFQQQLKDTIKFERQRNQKDQKQMQKLEQKYDQLTSQKQQLQNEIDQLKQQNKQCRKNMRVMKQKLEVYSKKYFLLHQQVQKQKQTEKELIEQICELRNGFGPSKYEKIRDLIEYHKSAIADDSTL